MPISETNTNLNYLASDLLENKIVLLDFQKKLVEVVFDKENIYLERP